MTLKSCLRSMRLRTLPLSLSGVMLGTFVAASHQTLSALTVALLMLTTALLQILSNLSNELGDTLHGTDTADRQGMRYSLQDGDMTVAQMRKLITFVAVACAVSGLGMIASTFGSWIGWRQLLLVLLGAAAMTAAMRYTLGKNPYGYRGWGDFFVFIFFGLVSVCGGYYVCLCQLPQPMLLIAASAIGLFSMAVLNVNNIRDMSTDAATRTTVALLLGERGARIYQTILIALGWVSMALYTLLAGLGGWSWLWLLSLPLFVKHLVGVWHRSGCALDPMLPLLVIGTFLFALLAGVGIAIAV
ncbi:MAG: 1,4-dihydroxy-2-naphthoate octaprenyltransferase [Bacteroidales bacterium]|nr:1,4-dihydroxy-2-naphthoate octaprenyltransferase [Bacteroidales bacterium]